MCLYNGYNSTAAPCAFGDLMMLAHREKMRCDNKTKTAKHLQIFQHFQNGPPNVSIILGTPVM